MPRGGNPRIKIGSSFDDSGVRDGERALDRLGKAGGRASDSLSSSVGGAGKGMGAGLAAGLAPLAGIAAAGGMAAGVALVGGISKGMDTEEANLKFKAQLDLTAKESARAGRVAGKLYAGNYGDSLEEVNGAIRSVMTDIDGMRDASGDRLQGMTGDVISLAKTFDQDLGGVTRGVGQLMRTGLAKDGQEALNIITKGFQQGADKSGDYLDTLNEYGTQFRKLGLDGKDATGLMSQGLQAGARDADIVADAFKEFSIRAVDGSETTKEGFDAIGVDAEKMAARIGKGGDSAAGGLDTVLDKLRAIDDPVKRSQAAVALFGTQAEDLGDALFALDPSKAADGLGKVEGAARKVNQTIGSGTKSQLTSLKREIETTVSDLAGKAMPYISRAAGAVAGALKGARDGTGPLAGAVARVRDTISDWVGKNRGDINSVISAFKTVGRFAKEVFLETLLPNIKRSIGAAKDILGGLASTVRGIVRTVSGLLSGDWKKAWSGTKEAVSGAWKVIKATVVTGAENLWEIVKDLGPKLIKGIVKGLANTNKAIANGIWEGIKGAAKEIPGLAADALKGIGNYIKDAITSAIGKLNPTGWFGDGFGKAVGDGVGRSIPAFGGSLMGALPSMAPIAGFASRFGLGVSSGLRPGARTSSGNLSYHGTGEALDIAGNPSGMLAFFRYMKNTMGSALAELIYTPGGAGIRNGSPHTYSGQVAADHYDHVHVAIDTGAPGVGDGIGKGDRDLITSAASAGGIGPDILYGVWGAESRFSRGPGPVSKAGARGPFQFMPGTAQEMGVNAGNLRSAAFGAAKYLGRYKSRGTAGMLAAYNAGPGGNPNNAETRAYIPRVLGFAKQWVAAKTGSDGGAVNAGGGSSGGTGAATAQRSAQSAAKTALATQRALVGPGGGGYSQRLANIGLDRARNEGNPQETAKLVFKEAVEKRRRLNTVLAALKRRLTPATRQRLTEEATQLEADLKALSALMFDLTGGQAGVNADGIVGGTPEAAAVVSAAGGGGDADPGPTHEDYILSNIAKSRLTDDLSDDILYATELRDYRKRAMDAALADADPRNDAAAIEAWESAAEAVKQLTESIDQANALQRQRDELNQELVDNQRKIIALGDKSNDLQAMFASWLSGSIGGKAGLGFQAAGVPGTWARY